MAIGALALAFGLSAGKSLLGGLQNRALQKEENKSILETNRLKLVEMAHALGQTQVQHAAVRSQAATDLNTAGRMANTAGGDARAQAAAAGVRGASVDAVQNDIEMELSRAIGEIETAAIVQTYNLNEQARSIAQSTLHNLGYLNKVASPLQVLGSSLVDGALSAGSQYASAYFKFGGRAPNSAASPGRGGVTLGTVPPPARLITRG